jgi:hypothetical protein
MCRLFEKYTARRVTLLQTFTLFEMLFFIDTKAREMISKITQNHHIPAMNFYIVTPWH